MLKYISTPLVLVLALATGAAHAAGGETEIHDYSFSFEGPFGSYDQMQLQRGLHIYTDVCSACHGLKYVPMRTLADPGGPNLPADQVRAYAKQIEVFDPLLNDGDGDYRPGKWADHFPESADPNAPDLSLMAKARAGFHGPYGTGMAQLFQGMGGAEYIASILTGYQEAPSCAPEDFAGYYNVAFSAGGYPDECKDEHGHHKYPGSWIAMAPPLYGEDVEFADGHSNSLKHEALDVAAFLMWTAEPKQDNRKMIGFLGVLILTILSCLLYLTNKSLWAPIKRAAKTKGE